MEYRMKCNVCGKIFCYTDEDLKKNEDNAKMARINALGGVFSAMGGTPMQTHHMTGQANLHSSKIVDYKQCPHCHSRSISVYTGGDVEQASTSAATAKSINTSASAESLLKRAFMFLEDEEWETADAYCEACLDKDPELAEAYLAKLMAELHVKTQAGLKDLEKPFDDNSNYKKAIRFANDKLKNTLSDYIRQIHNRNEDARKDDILCQAKAKMNGKTIFDYEQAIPLLASIAGWKDADEQKDICQRKLAKLRLKVEEDRVERERLAELERQRAAQAALESQERKQKNKKILIKYSPIVVAVAVSILVIILLVVNVVIPGIKYSQADKLVEAGQYYEAIQIYGTLGDSPKATKRIDAANYAQADAFMVSGDYKSAISLFEKLGDYEYSSEKLKEARYAYAGNCIADKDFISGIALYEQLKDSLGDYKDVAEKLKEARYAYGQDLMSQERSKEAIIQFEKVGNYKDAKEKIEQLKTQILSDQWSADMVAFNTDPDDRTTIMAYAPTKTNYLHVLFQITGGAEGDVLDIRDTITWQDGKTWEGEQIYSIKNGNYFIPQWSNGSWDTYPGTVKIEIVRHDTNEVIGEFSFEVK